MGLTVDHSNNLRKESSKADIYEVLKKRQVERLKIEKGDSKTNKTPVKLNMMKN